MMFKRSRLPAPSAVGHHAASVGTCRPGGGGRPACGLQPLPRFTRFPDRSARYVKYTRERETPSWPETVESVQRFLLAGSLYLFYQYLRNRKYIFRRIPADSPSRSGDVVGYVKT